MSLCVYMHYTIIVLLLLLLQITILLLRIVLLLLLLLSLLLLLLLVLSRGGRSPWYILVERVFGLVFVCSGLQCGGERVFGCVPVFAVFGGCFTVVFGSVRLPLLILYCVRLNACSRVPGRAKVYTYVYIYIYIEREKDMYIYIYIYT